jgi:hypothetical protein
MVKKKRTLLYQNMLLKNKITFNALIDSNQCDIQNILKTEFKI